MSSPTSAAQSVVQSVQQRASSSFRILVVEDDPQLRKLYSSVLSVFGFRYVEYAKSGEEAIEKLSETRLPFDLVILDWHLGGEMDGMDVLYFIRRESRRIYTPVLISTGMTQLRHVKESREGGMTDFLAKPFSVDQLGMKIKRMISKPRKFIKTDFYIGPCRRVRDMDMPVEKERRVNPW